MLYFKMKRFLLYITFSSGSSNSTASNSWSFCDRNKLLTSIVDRHRSHMAAKIGLFVDEDHSKLPTLYW